VIVTKLILIQISLEILRANGMINTIDTTFNKAPEALNCVHMVDTLGVDTLAVIDNPVRIAELPNVIVGGELIGMNGVFSGAWYVIPDEGHYSACLNVCSDRSINLPLFSMG